MWMAEPMDGQIVVELPTYSPAFKEVYRFIVEATNGDIQAATDLFLKYLAGEMPEGLLSISRRWVETEQAGANEGKVWTLPVRYRPIKHSRSASSTLTTVPPERVAAAPRDCS